MYTRDIARPLNEAAFFEQDKGDYGLAIRRDINEVAILLEERCKPNSNAFAYLKKYSEMCDEIAFSKWE